MSRNASVDLVLNFIGMFPDINGEGYMVRYSDEKDGVSALAFYQNGAEDPFLVSTGKTVEGTDNEIYTGCHPYWMLSHTEDREEFRGEVKIICSLTEEGARSIATVGRNVLSWNDPEGRRFGYVAVLHLLNIAEMVPDKSFGFWRGEGILEETSRLVVTEKSPAFPIIVGMKPYDIHLGGEAFFFSDDMKAKWTEYPKVATLREKLRLSALELEEGDPKRDALEESVISMDKYHILSGDVEVVFFSPYLPPLPSEMTPSLIFTVLHGALALNLELGLLHGFLEKSSIMIAPWSSEGSMVLSSPIGKFWLPNTGTIGVIIDVENSLDSRSTREEVEALVPGASPEAIPWLFCHDAMTLCSSFGLEEESKIFREGLRMNLELWKEGKEPSFDEYGRAIILLAKKEGYDKEKMPVVDYFNISLS